VKLPEHRNPPVKDCSSMTVLPLPSTIVTVHAVGNPEVASVIVQLRVPNLWSTAGSAKQSNINRHNDDVMAKILYNLDRTFRIGTCVILTGGLRTVPARNWEASKIVAQSAKNVQSLTVLRLCCYPD
jgi:hypothetical protein